MELDLSFGKTLCYATVFSINGIDAISSDFGTKYDRSPGTADDYGCGDMQFTRVPPKPEVLKKYKITEEEYALIASKLEDGLSFGSCWKCE